ncbi:transposase [Thermodesulfobacteriota bacterium]
MGSFIKELINTYSGYFVFRCPGSSIFSAVISFLASGQDDAIIWVDPTHSCRVRSGVKKWRQAKPIKLRVIKLVSPDGTISVLLTNLFDAQSFSREDITDLYFRRWEVEIHYRNEKTILDIEKFHGKSPNSIRQELFAIMIISVISRILMYLSESQHHSGKGSPQFKNAVITIAYDAAALTPDDPAKAIKIFKELLHEIARVKYYVSQKKRPSQPRITKRKINRWSVARQRKMLCH